MEYALSAQSAPRQWPLVADGLVRRLSRRRWDKQAGSTSPQPLDLVGVPVVLDEPGHGFYRVVSTGGTCSPACWRIPPTPRAGLDFSGPEAWRPRPPDMRPPPRRAPAPRHWAETRRGAGVQRAGCRPAVGPGPAPGLLPDWPPTQRAALDARVPGDPTHPRPRRRLVQVHSLMLQAPRNSSSQPYPDHHRPQPRRSEPAHPNNRDKTPATHRLRPLGPVHD